MEQKRTCKQERSNMLWFWTGLWQWRWRESGPAAYTEIIIPESGSSDRENGSSHTVANEEAILGPSDGFILSVTKRTMFRPGANVHLMKISHGYELLLMDEMSSYHVDEYEYGRLLDLRSTDR
jgi:hypothetical protein